MRQGGANSTLSSAAIFIYHYPVFSFFVFISAVLMLITMALSFGAISHKWEKRCARLLVFSIIPVGVGMVYFFKPVFSPILITLIIWSFFPLSFAFKKIKSNIQKNREVAEIKGWVCEKCKTVNEAVFLVCKECKAHQ